MPVHSYFIIGLLLLGLSCLIWAWHIDGTSSFEGGSFIGELFLAVFGVVLIVGALGWLFVLSLFN